MPVSRSALNAVELAERLQSYCNWLEEKLSLFDMSRKNGWREVLGTRDDYIRSRMVRTSVIDAHVAACIAWTGGFFESAGDDELRDQRMRTRLMNTWKQSHVHAWANLCNAGEVEAHSAFRRAVNYGNFVLACMSYFAAAAEIVTNPDMNNPVEMALYGLLQLQDCAPPNRSRQLPARLWQPSAMLILYLCGVRVTGMPQPFVAQQAREPDVHGDTSVNSDVEEGDEAAQAIAPTSERHPTVLARGPVRVLNLTHVPMASYLLRELEAIVVNHAITSQGRLQNRLEKHMTALRSESKNLLENLHLWQPAWADAGLAPGVAIPAATSWLPPRHLRQDSPMFLSRSEKSSLKAALGNALHADGQTKVTAITRFLVSARLPTLLPTASNLDDWNPTPPSWVAPAIEIEHIFPVSPAHGTFTPEVRRSFNSAMRGYSGGIHRLHCTGNLLALEKRINNACHTSAFSDKKVEYRGSNIRTARWLADHPWERWTPECQDHLRALELKAMLWYYELDDEAAMPPLAEHLAAPRSQAVPLVSINDHGLSQLAAEGHRSGRGESAGPPTGQALSSEQRNTRARRNTDRSDEVDRGRGANSSSAIVGVSKVQKRKNHSPSPSVPKKKKTS